MIKNFQTVERLKIIELDNSYKKLKDDFEKSKLLAIGEMHGVKENVSFYRTLAEDLKIDTIALEFPSTSKEPLMEFLKSGDTPNHYIFEKISDGRVSMEILSLLKDLYDKGQLKKIICFDGQIDIQHWNDREVDYAKNFLKEYNPKDRTLLIAGRYHIATSTFKADFEKGELKPMCFNLKDDINPFPICFLIYSGGFYYNFEKQEFPIYDEYANVESFTLTRKGSNSYEFLIKNSKSIEGF